MSIRRVIILSTLLIVLGVAGLLFGVSQLMLRTNEQTEQQQMKSELFRAQADLTQQLTDFGSFVQDWAASGQFVSDKVTVESMKSANESTIVFLDKSGKLVFSKEIDRDRSVEIPLSGAMTQLITQPEASRAGVVMEGNSVMLVAAFPLTATNRTKPIEGTLIMARAYKPKVVDLGNNTALTSSLESLMDGLDGIPFAYQDRVKQGELVIIPENDTTITAYRTITDVKNETSILIKISEPRTVIQQSTHLLVTYGVTSALLVTLFGILLIILSDKLISSPLVLLQRELSMLVSSKDFRKRIQVAGLREHRNVSRSINQLMEMNQQLAETTSVNTAKMKEQLIQIEAKNQEMENTKVAMMNILEDERVLEEQLRSGKAHVEEVVAERTQELVQEQAKLKGSIESLPVGYLMIDKVGSPVMTNKEATRIVSGMDIAGMLAQVKVWLKDDKVAVLDETTGLPTTLVEMTGIGYNNSSVDLSVVPIQAIDSAGSGEQRIGWVVLLNDVTEAKNLQRSRDEFFSIASHELRTPLTAIRGNTALIREYYPELMKDESVRQIMDDTHRAAVRLIAIVNDFLDASRLELKKIEFKIEKFDLVPLLTKVVDAIKPTAIEKKIGLDLELGDIHELLVSGDMSRTEQVLYNLLGNAQKFTKEGGVTVAIKLIDKGAEVWITDSGTGIPAENQRLLFRKFQQAGESVFTREAAQGSGMGLYITKLLTEGMGGTVRLESSTLGKGSTFVFQLPF